MLARGRAPPAPASPAASPPAAALRALTPPRRPSLHTAPPPKRTPEMRTLVKKLEALLASKSQELQELEAANESLRVRCGRRAAPEPHARACRVTPRA